MNYLEEDDIFEKDMYDEDLENMIAGINDNYDIAIDDMISESYEKRMLKELNEEE